MSDARMNFEVAETLFGQTVQKRMDEMNISIKDLSDRTGSAYETIRKLVRGLAFPSKYMAHFIATELNLDPQSLIDLANTDKLKHKLGNAPAIFAKKNPELEPIERLWGYLRKSQKKHIIETVRVWAKENRERKIFPLDDSDNES
jgi:transcriptional regulator with XRE-family HTH domain